MLHRFDLHVHSFFSGDAASAPESLIAAAKAKGLSGIAITDHDTCEAHEYLLEKGLERADGTAVDGFLVIPGVEVSTGDGHLLCLGTMLPQMTGHPAIEVCAAIIERGGIAIPAHPYDSWRAGIREEILNLMEIQAIEVFNAAVTSKKFNDLARAYAEKRGLKMTAASDAHHSSAVGVSAVVLELPELSVPAVLAALVLGGELEARYLSLGEAVKKHLGNWFRIFNARPR